MCSHDLGQIVVPTVKEYIRKTQTCVAMCGWYGAMQTIRCLWIPPQWGVVPKILSGRHTTTTQHLWFHTNHNHNVAPQFLGLWYLGTCYLKATYYLVYISQSFVCLLDYSSSRSSSHSTYIIPFLWPFHNFFKAWGWRVSSPWASSCLHWCLLYSPRVNQPPSLPASICFGMCRKEKHQYAAAAGTPVQKLYQACMSA